MSQNDDLHVASEARLIEIPEVSDLEAGDGVTNFDYYQVSGERQTFIETLDEKKDGGMHHWYRVGPGKFDKAASNFKITQVYFQKGPIQETGVNGCQNEDLLFMVLHRLVEAQKGTYHCEENRWAIHFIKKALLQLEQRTNERKRRGVEGTGQV